MAYDLSVPLTVTVAKDLLHLKIFYHSLVQYSAIVLLITAIVHLINVHMFEVVIQ